MAGLPFVLIVIPFGLVFGAVATKAGLTIIQSMTMTVTVVAGASQLTAVAGLQDHLPTLMIILVAVAVNLRMAMYSASLTPHLGKASMPQRLLMAYLMLDQVYAVSIAKYEQKPDMPLSAKVAYYVGVGAAIVPLWHIACLLGALLGDLIPPEYPIDFFVPTAFIAIIAPLLRKLAPLCAALTSLIIGLLCAGLPYKSGIFVAAFAAMIVGAQVELWLSRRIKALQAEDQE